MERAAFSFALAGVAGAAPVARQGGACAGGAVRVGAIPWRSPRPRRPGRAACGEERFDAAARAALQAASPLRHNGYKVPLARALLKRALRNLQAEKAAG
jgi:xanthine dehydrogenase YagS FAD-binding subunit